MTNKTSPGSIPGEACIKSYAPAHTHAGHMTVIPCYLSFQMSLLYSAIVRSLEKYPAFAILTRLI